MQINSPQTYTLEEIERELMSPRHLAAAHLWSHAAWGRLEHLCHELRQSSQRIEALVGERLQ